MGISLILLTSVIQINFSMLSVAVSGPESCELTGWLLPACCGAGHT
jgi:hypothetical protein